MIDDTPIDIRLGLPGPLPEGERILWHGHPERAALARYLFRWRLLAAYFAAFALLPMVATAQQGGRWVQVALSPALLLPFALIAFALLHAGAWLVARTSTYIITDRRVIFQVGAAYTRTINIPLKLIAHVGERERSGSCDIALTLKRPNKIAWAALWPHARALRLAAPVPLMRGLAADCPAAAILVDALMREAPGMRHARPEPARTAPATARKAPAHV
ncbi:MAG: PH domain-containing protein [Porphyrobacter sp.]|nr:PH domain-containing protein [Porphyrobacter sp.]